MNESGNNHSRRGTRHPVDGAQVVVSARTQLLRAAADDELTAQQEADLERHLARFPEDQAVIDFERKLQQTIAGSAAGSAPAHLRDRVERIRTQATDDSNVAIQTPSRLHRGSSRGWLAAAAAIAILLSGAYLILKPGGDDAPPVASTMQEYRISLVSFIRREHKECELHADQIGTLFRTSELADVPAEFAQILGSSPNIGTLAENGFTLLGAGQCAVPGRGKSVRMVLEYTAGASQVDGRGPLISIHIQKDTGDLSFEPGKTFLLTENDRASDAGAASIYTWRHGGFVYFLTSKSEPAMQKARESLGAGAVSGPI